MVKMYSFGLWRTEIMFDKYLILPSSPFCWKKSSIKIVALPAFKCGVGFLSAFIFLVQSPASTEMPFPFIIAYQNPSPLTSSEKGISPFHLPHRCLNALACPPGTLSIRALPPFRLLGGRLFPIMVFTSVSHALSECS